MSVAGPRRTARQQYRRNRDKPRALRAAEKLGGVPLPVWFHSQAGGNASFGAIVVMMSASDSSGAGGGGGAGGAGASGGGSSGAG